MILSNIEFSTLLLLGLAAFRVTRLIVFDKIMEPIRRPFFNEVEELDETGKKQVYLIPKEKGIRHWLGELLSCYWCTGFWVSLLLTFLYLQHALIAQFIILLFAIAAIGSIIETLVSKWIGH